MQTFSGLQTGSSLSLIRSDFELVATDSHAAPSPRPLLTGVEEVKKARLALANAMGVSFVKKLCHVGKDRAPQIGRSLRVEERLWNDRTLLLT